MSLCLWACASGSLALWLCLSALDWCFLWLLCAYVCLRHALVFSRVRNRWRHAPFYVVSIRHYLYMLVLSAYSSVHMVTLCVHQNMCLQRAVSSQFSLIRVFVSERVRVALSLYGSVCLSCSGLVHVVYDWWGVLVGRMCGVCVL